MPWRQNSPPTTPRGKLAEIENKADAPAEEKEDIKHEEDGRGGEDHTVREDGKECREEEKRKGPRKMKKQPVVDLVKDLEIKDNGAEEDEVEGEGERRGVGKPRRKYASLKDLKKGSFYEDLLRGELGFRRTRKAEFNRVIYLLGDRSDKSLSTKEWRACAQGILRASDHTDAFVVETASSKSVLGCVRKDLLKLGKTAAVDAFDASTSDSSSPSPFHKATIVLTDVSGKDNEDFVRAKQDLVEGLAGGFKVVALWIGRPDKDKVEQFQAELSGIKERQWPLLTLHHIEERDVETGEKICKYPKASLTSAELASFIHVHLTVDIFNM